MAGHDHDIMTDEAGRTWYTARHAADLLGVSANTLRRRVKRGELEGLTEQLPHGPTLYVPADAIDQTQAALVVVKAKRTESAQELAFAVAELMRQENNALVERLDALQSSVDALNEKLDAQTENANKGRFRWPWSK